ncbi:3-oxoacyl-ACP reductase FabG [uncultured Pseudacidovorax sp.]|uniref:3-oxoacyl-ACP reductase FabG n=1 Tax=uncultured Pseudacidovorax sp. TaxID=679313 RepID=UPI0025DA9C42|nr:3-oxoacyl-ACP reductase FabG [uncultured Pseudacidovorax sp.]
MDLHLEQKRVLVTGGSSGLGAAIVKAFADAGARVAINYRSKPDAAEALADACRHTAAGRPITVHADIADAQAVDGMFEALDQAWSGIDVLVNNAGIDGEHALAWEADAQAWGRVIDVNLKGAFLCAHHALRRMVPQKSGVILNTTSVHETIAWSGYSAYCASKAGLTMMGRTLAQEAAPHGVRVLSLAPGAIRTPINRDVWENPASHADLLRKIPLGRMGEPEDIADMAVVLASHAARYMTGTTVFVDGGMTDYPDFAHGG